MVEQAAYLKAAYPPPLDPPHLSDEDIAVLLDRMHKESKQKSDISNKRAARDDDNGQPNLGTARE